MSDLVEEFVDVGIIKNDLMASLDSDVAQSPDWIHHVPCDKQKQQLVKELFKIYHIMQRVVNSSNMIKHKINEKHFFTELLKNTFILIQCCNQFQLSDNDDQSLETNETLKRIFTDVITLVSSYMNEVKNESKRFVDLFSIDEEKALSHDKVRSGLITNFDKMHEILKPMSLIMSKSSSKMSISKYIFDNYESFKTMMISVKPCFKSALMELAVKNEEYEDVMNETHQVVSNFIELQTILEKKIRDRNTSSKINALVSKMKTDMTKIKGKHANLYDNLPSTVINFIKMISEAQQSSSQPSSSNGKKTRKNGVKDDPWSGKRHRKRNNTQKSNSSAAESTDGEQRPKKKGVRPASLGDNKSEYNDKHIELFTNGQGLLQKINVLEYTEAANNVVKEMKNKLFAKYNIPEDTQKLVLEKINLKNMIKMAKKQTNGVACSSSDRVATDLLDTFRNYKENVAHVFDKTQGNVIIPSDYCLRYSDGVFGKNAPYLIIYAFFNVSDVDNPVALKLIPTYTMNKMISFKTLSVFVMELNHRMKSGKALLLEKPEKNQHHEKSSEKKTSEPSNVNIDEYEKMILDMGVKIHKFDTLKTIPAKLNAKTKTILGDFLRRNKIDGKKYLDVLFPTLFHKKVPVVNEDYDLQGAIAQDGRMIEFMCFGNGKNHISFESDLYKNLEYSTPADVKTTKEVKQLYLYPTCMSIVRRFSTMKSKPSVKPKQYQLFMVYDVDEDSILTKNDKSPFGYIGFIEKNNVFRVISNLNDIDPVSLSLVGNNNQEEDIELSSDDDYSSEYHRKHSHWVHVLAYNVAEKQRETQKKPEKSIHPVVKKKILPKQFANADLI